MSILSISESDHLRSSFLWLSCHHLLSASMQVAVVTFPLQSDFTLFIAGISCVFVPKTADKYSTKISIKQMGALSSATMCLRRYLVLGTLGLTSLSPRGNFATVGYNQLLKISTNDEKACLNAKVLTFFFIKTHVILSKPMKGKNQKQRRNIRPCK